MPDPVVTKMPIRQLFDAVHQKIDGEFPLYFGARELPAADKPPRVVMLPRIGQWVPPTLGLMEDPSGRYIADRQLQLVFNIWGCDDDDVDYLIIRIYSVIETLVGQDNIVSAQEIWSESDQLDDLGDTCEFTVVIKLAVESIEDPTGRTLRLDVRTRIKDPPPSP